MVAYPVQPQFVDAIRAGTKTQTIRPPRKIRHTRPGERFGLYVNMRRPDCELLEEVECVSIEEITIDFEHDTVNGIGGSGGDEFARADGFVDWAAMKAWFAKTHSDTFPRFTGFLIKWKRT